MKSGEIRYCACGCGQPAKRCYSGDKFKSWRAYASGHAPNESVPVRVPQSVEQVAYAAGIIDGEGCIYARVHMLPRGTISTYLQLSVRMCSESVVAWLASTFGGEMYVAQPRSGTVRLAFVWQIRGAKIAPVLRSLLPYLIEKKQRAAFAIELAGLLDNSKPGRSNKISDVEMARRRELAASIKAFNQNQRSEDAVH